MAALRFLLVAGLCSAASAAAGDDHSLVQREVGVHVPEAVPEDIAQELPEKVLRRLEPAARAQMVSAMGPFLDSLIRLLRAIEKPLEIVTSKPIHYLDNWTAEEFSVLSAGVIAGYSDPKLPAQINKTLAQMANTLGEMGAKLGGTALQLTNSFKGGVTTKDAVHLLEMSAYEAAGSLTGSAGQFLHSLGYFQRGLRTEYLKKASQKMKDGIYKQSWSNMMEYSTKVMHPWIKSMFEGGEVCKPLQFELSAYSQILQAVRADVPEAISLMKSSVSSMEPIVMSINSTLVPQVASHIRYVLDTFGTAVTTAGVGLRMYHEALTEVAKTEGCITSQ